MPVHDDCYWNLNFPHLEFFMDRMPGQYQWISSPKSNLLLLSSETKELLPQKETEIAWELRGVGRSNAWAQEKSLGRSMSELIHAYNLMLSKQYILASHKKAPSGLTRTVVAMCVLSYLTSWTALTIYHQSYRHGAFFYPMLAPPISCLRLPTWLRTKSRATVRKPQSTLKPSQQSRRRFLSTQKRALCHTPGWGRRSLLPSQRQF